jgi:DNA-binding transcriptional ArsR family regulator
MPSPEVAELLETIKRTVADPKAGEAGYTLVLAVVGPHASTVGCASAADMGGVLERDENLVRFAVAFTNPGRLRIIRALARGPRTSGELSKETDLAGGQLYHHLKELMRSGLVIQEARDSYALSPWIGAPAYLGMNLLTRTIARAAEKRRGDR